MIVIRTVEFFLAGIVILFVANLLAGCAVRGIDHFGSTGGNGNSSEWAQLSKAVK